MFNNEDINNTIKTKINISAFDGGNYIEYEAFENKACVKKSDSSEIELELEPYHSKIIAFGDVDYKGIDEYILNEYDDAIEIQPMFKISVAPHNSEKFDDYKVTEKLFNVTGRNELPDFSGHIKYEAEINLEKEEYLLDLGYVGEAAEVYINDEKIGEKQVPPYTYEIKSANLKPQNKLTVIVSNHNGFSRKDRFSKYLLFEPSGLIGPIKIRKKLS